jgi:hypothetical protein
MWLPVQGVSKRALMGLSSVLYRTPLTRVYMVSLSLGIAIVFLNSVNRWISVMEMHCSEWQEFDFVLF